MSLAVFHHRCGRREVLLPNEHKAPCPECDRINGNAMEALAAQTKARMVRCFLPRSIPARLKFRSEQPA